MWKSSRSMNTSQATVCEPPACRTSGAQAGWSAASGAPLRSAGSKPADGGGTSSTSCLWPHHLAFILKFLEIKIKLFAGVRIIVWSEKQRAENFLFSGLGVSSSPPSFERWPCSVCYLDIFRWRIPHARPKPAMLKKQRGSLKQLSHICWSVATWPKLCRSVTMEQSARRPVKICWDRRTRMEPIWSGTARPSREPCVCVFSEYSVFSSSRFIKQENLSVLLWKPKLCIYAHFWLLFTNVN